jgi:hypothetical protein
MSCIWLFSKSAIFNPGERARCSLVTIQPTDCALTHIQAFRKEDIALITVRLKVLRVR